MNFELENFLQEMGIMPEQDSAKFPSREQALSKDWHNTLNLTQEEDGSWTPSF